MKINLSPISYNGALGKNYNFRSSLGGNVEVPAARGLKYPSFENIRAIYMSAIPFKGSDSCDNILPPKFKNETLNDILSRNTDISGLSTKDVEPRKEGSEVLSSYLSEDGLVLMQMGEAYNVMYNRVATGQYDGVSFEEADKFFMMGIQRLVDNGVIDDKTFVLIDTGHAIPMAAQLMDESNRASLGNVKGSFILGETSFPEGCPNAKTEADAKVQELARNCSYGRISSHALTYGDKISSAYKNNTGENGALFAGVDFHRQTRLDISKLPTVEELKELGINKVIVVQELPPVSSFSPDDAARIYQPLTQEQAEKSLRYMKRACKEAEKTPVGETISEDSKSLIKGYLHKASDALGPDEIEKTYARLGEPDKKAVSKQIEKMKFGYNTRTSARGDVTDYLRQIKKDSRGSINVVLEGADLMKLRTFPLDAVTGIKHQVVTREAEGFEQTLSGDYLGANEELQ